MKTLSTNKIGRPTVITADIITKLESIFKIGGTDEEAITYAEIGNRTYYDHLEADEAFRSKMTAAKHYADVVAKNVVVDAIVKNKDLSTAKWWLEKRQFKDQPTTPGQQYNQFNILNINREEAEQLSDKFTKFMLNEKNDL